jgi:hypothetical protein
MDGYMGRLGTGKNSGPGRPCGFSFHPSMDHSHIDPAPLYLRNVTKASLHSIIHTSIHSLKGIYFLSMVVLAFSRVL